MDKQQGPTKKKTKKKKKKYHDCYDMENFYEGKQRGQLECLDI